ncbi:uncharacterized protein LOC117114752 [Anneissia japonica]|uniref:uncharacterized protein LOC117114752 n=1 Tax=Anneissia japonica TaxID=1529436 RepID=UPI001425B00B|nr:uncharacterized protein LOC117114752 [Anneissia japonica]
MEFYTDFGSIFLTSFVHTVPVSDGQQTPGPIVVRVPDRPICTGAPLATPEESATKKIKGWEEEMDNDLVKEMLNSNIFSYKYNSKSRGAQWKLLAEKLNECWGDGFQTNERALRDKDNGLKKRFKNKIR